MTFGPEPLRQHWRARRHTALLVAITAAIMVRPLIGEGGATPFVFSIAVLVLLLVALYTTQVDELVGDRDTLQVRWRRRRLVGWALAVPAIVERLALLFAPSRLLLLMGSVAWLLFFSFVTACQLRSLVRHKQVTSETISMSISIYLLLGLTWGLLYIVIFQLQPQAFGFAGGSLPPSQELFPIFFYFSLTTLSTIGFGDIIPLTLQARYAAVAEGIAGQLYLAILVARLVGIHMSGHAQGGASRPADR